MFDRFLTQILIFFKCAWRWLWYPHFWETQKNIYVDILKYNENDDNFLENVITCDDFPETNSPSSLRAKKERMHKSKLTAIKIFFKYSSDSSRWLGISWSNCLSVYRALMKRKTVKTLIVKNGLRIHQNECQVLHIICKDVVGEAGILMLEHPPYSSNMALHDFFPHISAVIRTQLKFVSLSQFNQAWLASPLNVITFILCSLLNTTL